MYYKIVGKRWFQRTYGNTYHSVAVYKCSGTGKNYTEKLLGYHPMTYGYDEQYLQTALEVFQSAGVYKKTGKSLSSGANADYCAFRDTMRAHPERFVVIVHDVTRQRDL